MDAARLRKIVAENQQYNQLRAKDAARAAAQEAERLAALEKARQETRTWVRTLNKTDAIEEIVQKLAGKVLESAEAGRTSYFHYETLWTLFGFCGCADYTCDIPPLPEEWHDDLYSALQTQFSGCKIVFENGCEGTLWVNIEWS